jgi:hypothetical protein
MLEGLQSSTVKLLQAVQDRLSGKSDAAAASKETSQTSITDSLDLSQTAAAYTKEGAQALAAIKEGQRELVELDIEFARMRASEIKKQIETVSYMMAYGGGDSLRALDSYAMEIGKNISNLGSHVRAIGRNAEQLGRLGSFRDFAVNSFNSAASETREFQVTVTSFRLPS